MFVNDETRIDAAARHLRETLQAGKRLTPWNVTPPATKRKWLKLAEGTLRSAGDFRVTETALTTAWNAGRDAAAEVVDAVAKNAERIRREAIVCGDVGETLEAGYRIKDARNIAFAVRSLQREGEKP